MIRKPEKMRLPELEPTSCFNCRPDVEFRSRISIFIAAFRIFYALTLSYASVYVRMLHSIFSSQLLSPTLDGLGQAYDKKARIIVFRSSLMETSGPPGRIEHPEGRERCLLVPCNIDSGHDVENVYFEITF
jgi:hypothetical protein